MTKKYPRFFAVLLLFLGGCFVQTIEPLLRAR